MIYFPFSLVEHNSRHIFKTNLVNWVKEIKQQEIKFLLAAVPIRCQGGFDAIPGDEIKMQMQSDAVQPCKLYFW